MAWISLPWIAPSAYTAGFVAAAPVFALVIVRHQTSRPSSLLPSEASSVRSGCALFIACRTATISSWL